MIIQNQKNVNPAEPIGGAKYLGVDYGQRHIGLAMADKQINIGKTVA